MSEEALDFPPELTLHEASRLPRREFSAAGFESAEVEARALLLAAAGLSLTQLTLAPPEAQLGPAVSRRLSDYARRRLAREPVSRIIGARGFWSVDLAVVPGVLDPRADTEAVVELSLRLLRDRRDEPLMILDLGSGSGAILCALLSELPAARGLAVDISVRACAATKANLACLGLAERGKVICGRWAEAICGKYDLVVSNPPYVRRGELSSLSPEVALHDPWTALDGGEDGFDAYRAIVAQLPEIVKSGGFAAFEAGAGQSGRILKLLDQAGFCVAPAVKDLAGTERAVGGRFKLGADYGFLDTVASF